MSTDPYLLPGSGVLRNKLGICDNRRLAAAEFDLSYARWLELAGDNLLAGMGQDRFAQRLAHHYGTLNVIHPFREGNGRTQRAYWSLVAAQAGWSIDWAAVSKAGNDRACAINLATGDETVLRELLEPAISRLNDDNDPFAKLQTGR